MNLRSKKYQRNNPVKKEIKNIKRRTRNKKNIRDEPNIKKASKEYQTNQRSKIISKEQTPVKNNIKGTIPQVKKDIKSIKETNPK